MNIDNLIEDLNNKPIENVIKFAVSNSYISKFYFDSRLNNIPIELKNTLKQIMVSLAEENGGIIEAIYDDKQTICYFDSYASDDDYMYDEIGAKYKLRQIEKLNENVLEELAFYCKFKFRNMDKIFNNLQ